MLSETRPVRGSTMAAMDVQVSSAYVLSTPFGESAADADGRALPVAASAAVTAPAVSVTASREVRRMRSSSSSLAT